MKKNVTFAALGALLLALAGVVTIRTQQRRKISTLWQEATTQVSTNGSTPTAAHAH